MGIRIETTRKDLSKFGGLKIVQRLCENVGLYERLLTVVPEQKRGARGRAKKVMDLVYGLMAGADCLDDMGRLGQDPGFEQICDGHVHHPKTYGDTLRAFGYEHYERLSQLSREFALEMRGSLLKAPTKRLILDCDSTKNRQYGLKMEGVAHCHEKYLALDTINIFDENGLQYYSDVRSGNTHTSKSCAVAIHSVISQLRSRPELAKSKVWMRADSGYYGAPFIEACLSKKIDLILAVPKKGNFYQLVSQVREWIPTNPDDETRIKFKDGRECEIGVTTYRMAGISRRLNYIIIRALKPNDGGLFSLKGVPQYDYYAFCTSLDFHILSPEEIVKTYRARGQAENYIKEAKGAFDQKHYPCQKLMANRVFAVLTQIAYNIFRFLALSDNYEKPFYGKNIRYRWISVPCLVARGARGRVFRLMGHHFKEIAKWLDHINRISLGFARLSQST